MNRLFKSFVACICLLVLFVQAGWAADGYRFLPAVQEDEASYTLTLNTQPSNAGSFNRSSGQTFAAGESIYMYYYANTDFVFDYWMSGDTIVSRDRYFYFIMPDHDATLTAVFHYDPDNPNNPDSPNQNKKYTLTLNAQPSNAGSFNRGSGEQFKAGESVYLYGYNNDGFKFEKWMSADTVVSTSRNFYFSMPNHDAELTAVYSYDPNSPVDPDTVKVYYNVTLETQPSNAGTFSWNSTTKAVAHSSCEVYAYPNSDFTFREWQQDGETVGTDRRYRFEMPAANIRLVAVYDYTPANPSNPNNNYWNPETGELIVDDFTPDYLYNAVYQATGGNYDKVQMITVAGPISQYDWGVVNNCANCTLLDMSRTYGLNYIPSYNFSDNATLTTVILPSGIEKIGDHAFLNCSNLQSLSIHAATPPTIGTGAFEGAGNFVVYVPADALSLYQEAEGWKNFTILPFADEVSALEVNLPQGTDPSIYKDMYIELINTKSGQKLRYVITNRLTYTFNSLIHRTSYNVYLRNAQGDVLGEIDGIDIIDEDVSVTFESLKVPRDLTLTVLAPGGDDVTDQTTITWMDAKDTYLAKGHTLTGQMEGTWIKFRITLPQTLGMQYLLPADSLYEVLDENSISVTLKAIPQMTIAGKVTDLKTGLPLNGATIAVSQMLNGLYSKSFTTKTDNKGEWSLAVSEAKTDITASMPDYVSKSQSFETLVTEIPVFELKDINGTTISLTLTYTSTEGETQEFYSDYANVAYAVFNETTQKQVTEMNVQYPQIVLMEQLDEGTLLRVTATSKNQKFVPVTATATVNEKDVAPVTLPIVQLGGITATFKQTDNNSIVGILYDSNGRLINKYDYSSATLTISELQDGDYTLVTMANSQFFNSVATISQFAEAGLREGVDYVKNSATVTSGAYTVINNQQIPYLDETKLYYTGSNTRFSVNKSQVTAGQYLTLRGQIDFKPAYQERVSDVKMIFELPENCSFVDGSVMAGNAISSYTLDKSRLTVALENENDQVRFCVIPTIGGIYSPSASVEFDIDGRTICQPIGSVVFTVSNLSITVPSVVAKTTVPVLGTAMGKSEVEIFDNDVSVGHATALANGFWSAEIELNNPINLSTHSIYAKIVTKEGLELQSDVQELLYDQNAIEPTKITMINVAHPASSLELCEYVTEFDFTNPGKTSKPYWYWPNYPDFTFLIDFTNNDSTIVSDVTLYVLLSNNKVSTLKPVFDGKRKCWVATAKYTSDALPTNVMVDYSSAASRYFDKRQLGEATEELEGYMEEYQAMVSEINETFDGVTITEDTDDETVAELDDKFDELNAMFGDDVFAPLNTDSLDAILDAMSDEEFAAFMEKELADLKAEDANTAAYMNDLSQWLSFDEHGEFTLPSGTKFTMADCTGLTPEGLKDDGYMEMQCTDGSFVYVLIGEETTEYVDLVRGLRVTIQMATIANAPKNRSLGDVAEKVANAVAAINDFIKDINKWTLGLNAKILSSEKSLEYSVLALQMRVNRANYFINYAKTHGRWYERLSWVAEKMLLKKNLLQAKAAQWISKKIFKYALKALPVVKYVSLAVSLANDIKEIGTLYYSIPDPCPQDESDASFWRNSTYALLATVIVKATVELVNEFSSDAEIVGGVVGSVATAGVSLTASAWGIAQKALVGLGSFAVDAGISFAKNKIKNGIKKLKCYKNDDETKKEEIIWPFNPVEHVMDPSGFVYEAVSSNRLQGVTASCYYKEIVEDMYGDLHENIVLWNAEEYAQENPLFTDENGMYQWDVPQGLWRVKFEKEGYQTTYSEWLPVPPPQLDVNIPMMQMVQPLVKSGKAFANGVEFEFDKYMDPETLTADNILVTKNGSAVTGEIKLLNEEVTCEGQEQTYASKVRFEVPEGEELLVTDEVQLTVRKAVKSYAGVPMQDDYTQKFDVELQVRTVAVDSLINVAYGGKRTLTVAALPTDAAKGKTMRVKSLSGIIASADAETLTLDENGQAELEVTGELPGATVLNFKVDGTEIEGQTIVNVKEAEKLTTVAPRASRVSGTEVYRGTIIRLTSETENATIYYTLDGTCPCDLTSGSVLTYNPDEPIIIADENVTIKAMAVGHDLAESEVSEFTYSLKKTALGYQMPTGWSWISHNLEEPVATSKFETNAERIVSQTAEMIKDPNVGFIGNLPELLPAEGYKVKVTADTNNSLSGFEFNAHENAVRLASGWNWIGYPLSQIMTLDEALAFFTPSTGDYLVGQDGYAEYVDNEWKGTLEAFVPGHGYLYKSATQTEISFNTTIVSNAVSQVGKRMAMSNSPWAYNKYGWQNQMPLTAQLYVDGIRANEDDYIVGAFAGTECRGIGRWMDGRLLMSVYGEGGEDIRFVAAEQNTDKFYDITEAIRFSADNVGSWYAPFTLTLGGEATDIKQLYDGLTVTPAVAHDHITVSAGGMAISYLTLTNMNGVTVLTVTDLGKGGTIATGQLADGMYIVTVQAGGNTYYKKIIKTGK